jgi:hypothetical protein
MKTRNITLTSGRQTRVGFISRYQSVNDYGVSLLREQGMVRVSLPDSGTAMAQCPESIGLSASEAIEAARTCQESIEADSQREIASRRV